MVRRRRWRSSACAAFLVFGGVALAACGGRSGRTLDDDGGAGGTSGTSATGGTSGTSGSSGAGGGCAVNGVYYASGQSFPAPDACNTCTCENGNVFCTEIGCTYRRCALLPLLYDDSLLLAKACDPAAEFQCETVVSSGLVCGCPTFVGHPPAIDDLIAFEIEWKELGCARDVNCEPCPSEPIGAYCSDEGDCVDVF